MDPAPIPITDEAQVPGENVETYSYLLWTASTVCHVTRQKGCAPTDYRKRISFPILLKCSGGCHAHHHVLSTQHICPNTQWRQSFILRVALISRQSQRPLKISNSPVTRSSAHPLPTWGLPEPGRGTERMLGSACGDLGFPPCPTVNHAPGPHASPSYLRFPIHRGEGILAPPPHQGVL